MDKQLHRDHFLVQVPKEGVSKLKLVAFKVELEANGDKLGLFPQLALLEYPLVDLAIGNVLAR